MLGVRRFCYFVGEADDVEPLTDHEGRVVVDYDFDTREIALEGVENARDHAVVHVAVEHLVTAMLAAFITMLAAVVMIAVASASVIFAEVGIL